MKNKNREVIPLGVQINFDQGVIDRMKALGLSDKQVAQIYADYGNPENDDALLIATLDFVEKRASELPPLTSKTALFKKALRERFAQKA